jgi:hypothetical protein
MQVEPYPSAPAHTSFVLKRPVAPLNLVWRMNAWQHRERAGQRCRVAAYSAGRPVFEFTDGGRVVADLDLAIRPLRMKWSSGPARALRRRLFREAGYTCVHCGRRPPPRELQIDHILPLACGGKNEETNFQVLCESCNCRKGARIEVAA